MWIPVLTADGSYTFAHPLHGQTCHSRAGAWQETRERYAHECRLRERALELRARVERESSEPDATTATIDSSRRVLRLLDIGTGLGLNLAAALEALDGTDVELEAVSLEDDVSVIEAMLAWFDDPSRRGLAPGELERWHAPVRHALRVALSEPRGSVSAARDPHSTSVAMGGGTLTLLIGDARATLATLGSETSFDAVFLDPFSPAVEPDLWTFPFLAEVARRMAPGGMLATYTTSLAVRAKLAATGLSVGPGARVGTKAAGTIAVRGETSAAFDARTSRRIARRADEWRAARVT